MGGLLLIVYISIALSVKITALESNQHGAWCVTLTNHSDSVN